MKFVSALFVFVFASAAGAVGAEPAPILNEPDVVAARAQNDVLYAAQTGVLKLRILVAKILRDQLRAKRDFIKFVGLNEAVTPATVMLGFGTGAGGIFAGQYIGHRVGVAANQLFEPRTEALNERIRASEEGILRKKERIAVLLEKTQDASVLAEIGEIENGIELSRRSALNDANQILRERARNPRLVRIARNVLAASGVGLGLVLVADGVHTAYQVGYAPDRLAESEDRLTAYISHAEAVLRDRR